MRNLTDAGVRGPLLMLIVSLEAMILKSSKQILHRLAGLKAASVRRSVIRKK